MSSSPNQSSQARLKKTSRTRKILIPLGIIACGVAILILSGIMAPKPQKKPIVNKAPLVEVIEVTRGDIVFEIESQGSISPRTETTLVSEVSGVIKNVSDKFVVGGFFRKGELLLEIDPISYEVALLQAQARLDGARAKLVEERARGKQAEKEWSMTGRKKSNAPILALRKPQLQQAEADVKAAEADVRSAQIKLDRTRITAPYDAMVKSRAVDIGQYVTTGAQIATTFAVDYAEIRLPIKEHDFRYIEVPAMGAVNGKGSRVELSTVQGGVKKSLSTFITRSEGVVDSDSRVNYVVAQINDPYGLISDSNVSQPIRMGTFVKARIFGVETPDVISVPRKAVRGTDELYLVNDDKKLSFAKVNILRTDSKNIYVSEGLEAGDKVVLTKLATPIEGMSLRVEGDPESAINKNARVADKITPDTVQGEREDKLTDGENDDSGKEPKENTELTSQGDNL